MQKQSRWKQNEIRANLWLIIFAGMDLVRRAEISSLQQAAEEMQQQQQQQFKHEKWLVLTETCINKI